jgi:hypothetical protein
MELRVVGPVAVRGLYRGTWGPVARGLGVAIAVADRRDGRVFFSGAAGRISCEGSADANTCTAGLEPSRAVSAGLGGELRVSESGTVTVGIDVERWFALRGDHRSIYLGAFILRLRV